MDVVFTTHARERMAQRDITERMVYQVVSDPDRTYPEGDGDTKFIRSVNGFKVFVICKPLPDEGKWLVKSTWIRGIGDSDEDRASMARRPYADGSPRRSSSDYKRPRRRAYSGGSPRRGGYRQLVGLGLLLLVLLYALFELVTR